MPDQRDLEKRVEELEAQVRRLGGVRPRSVRYRSSIGLGDIPLVAVSLGPNLEAGEVRGHAKGIIAVGDVATGVIAIGGLARGVVCVGGLSLGLLSFGGLALGLGLAIGGLAIGGVALGGGAVGGAAVGGGAAGYYACGGAAVGAHVTSGTERDPIAEAFFRQHGLQGACPTWPRRR
jgi:hypothetical protein